MTVSTPTHSSNDTLLRGFLVVGVITAAVIASISSSISQVDLVVAICVGIPLIFVVLRDPFYGLVGVVCSLPLITLLPDIPLATSATSFLGALTLASYMNQRQFGSHARIEPKPAVKSRALWYASAFMYWSIMTGFLVFAGRLTQWLFTFLQLIILIWLMRTMLTTPQRHRVLMVFFSLSTVFSSAFIIRDALTRNDALYQLSLAGLSDSANNISRYAAVSLAFLSYLMTRTRNIYAKAIVGGAMGVVILGAAYSLSRTGFLLVILALGLMFMKQYQAQIQTRVVMLLIAFGVGLFLIPKQAFDQIRYQVLPALQRDTSETDIRLDLWDAAIRMTEDHLITGVGIGEYRNRLPDYGRGKAEGKNAGAHNMYLQILAETGIIGFGLFMALLINATLILWKASKHPDPEIAALAWTWLVALIVIMVGGLTKHDFQGKLLWTCLGASVAFQFSNWLPPLTQEVNYVAHFNHRRNIS